MICFPTRTWLVILLSNALIFTGLTEATMNLSCYQCTRTTETECSHDELLPCPSSSDRCVTHIMKNEKQGFVIKRECGLGPCSFNDLMMNKGLGMDTCDRSRDDYFCIFCCRESGCNKDGGTFLNPSVALLLCAIVFTIVRLRNVPGLSAAI